MPIVDSLNCSSSAKEQRHPMSFGNNWGEGDIFVKYHNLKSKTMTRIEIRITRGVGVPHRFVLAYMTDGSVCRFDRRPFDANAAILAAETATTPERRAADEFSFYKDGLDLPLSTTTHLEIDLHLPPGTDVILIFSACFALDKDPEARKYALWEYNCYFFSWTIAMIVVRHVAPFEIPAAADVKLRSQSRLITATASLTSKIVDALLGMVLDTVMNFRSETGRRLYSGLSKRELAVWGLPSPVVRMLLNQSLKVLLHFGLEKELRGRVRHQLESHTPEILRYVLRNQGEVGTNMQTRLWLFDLNSVFTPHFKAKVLDVIWDGMFEALSKEHGNPDSKPSDLDISRLPTFHRLKHRFFGKNVMQFSQIWTEALEAALSAAREAGHGRSQGKSHAQMFELAFTSGCKAALETAQGVVARTKDDINDPKRDQMWEVVWDVWNNVWETTRTRAQTMVVKLIDDTLVEMVEWVAQDVVAELGDSQTQKISAAIRFKKRQEKTWKPFNQESSSSRPDLDAAMAQHGQEIHRSPPSRCPNPAQKPLKHEESDEQGVGDSRNIFRRFIPRSRPGNTQPESLSLSAFQQTIRDFIWSIPVQGRVNHRQNVEAAMARAWDMSRQTFRPLVEAST